MPKEGFWKSNAEPGLPLPKPHEHPQKDIALFCDKLRRLQLKASTVSYRGWSTCRICGKPNGSEEFQLRNWSWPEGYLHYVEDHNVRPSPEFKEFVLGN